MENKLGKVMTVLMAAGLMVMGPMAYAESQADNSAGASGMHQSEPGDEGTEGGPGVHHRGQQEFFKDFNLTPEQKAKLKAQHEAKRESSKALREQLKTKMLALHEAISKPGAKRVDVNGLVEEVNALKGQMFAERIDGIFAMKEVLTPEQFAKMQAKHKEWMNKKHEGWGKHQKGPEGDQPEPEKD